MNDRPKRISFQPSEEQHEFLERMKRRHKIFKSQYVISLVRVEMEKEEDRLRPILSIESLPPQVFSHEREYFHGTDSGRTSPLPPVPFGTVLADIEKVVSVNSEVKSLIRDGKIKRARPWKPKATV